MDDTGRELIEAKASGPPLSRTEKNDLVMIIKDRTKVLKAYAEERAAACMADFERKLAAT